MSIAAKYGHPMPRVFISYRRDDSAAHAGRIYDRLRDRFGVEQVFRDIDAIAPGAKFAKVIADRIDHCDALIAIIGKDWLGSQDDDGKRRLDHPDDWVKAEIREALTRDKLVIPALVEGARMPKDRELPRDIAALAGCNAIEISESRFDFDTARLVQALEGDSPVRSSVRYALHNWRWIVLVSFGTVVALAVVLSSLPSWHWWKWIGDQDVQRTLGFLGGGLAAVVGAAWVLYVHFSRKPEKATAAVSVTASSGGIAVRGNVTAAPGGVINSGSNNTFNIGITLEQYDVGLKRREQEVRAELECADRADSAQITLLEGELAAVQGKQQNLEQSLTEYKRKLVEANRALEALKQDLPTDQLVHAQQALQKGDSAEAEKLLSDVMLRGKQHAAEAAFQLGKLAANRIDYAKAYEYYSGAVGLKPDDPLYLNDTGMVAFEIGQYAEAQALFAKAAANYEKTLGADHPEVASCLANLAETYRAQGQYDKAESLCLRALEIDEKSLGPEHPHVAGNLNNLAELYRIQGKYVDAEPLFQRALKLYEQSFGGDHWRVATVLNNLAALYKSQGEYDKAGLLQVRAMEISLNTLGWRHPSFATNVNNLARYYSDCGEYAVAEPLYLLAIKIKEKSLGAEHPDVATVLSNLGCLYVSREQYTEAEPLHLRALRIAEKCFGPDHPDVAGKLNNLAGLYESQGQHAQAEPLYQRALGIWQKGLPADHPTLSTGMKNYAKTLRNLGQIEEAEKWLAKAEGVDPTVVSPGAI